MIQMLLFIFAEEWIAVFDPRYLGGGCLFLGWCMAIVVSFKEIIRRDYDLS